MSAPVSSEDNELIVALISAGDARGGELLYERYSRGLLFLAQRYCPGHEQDCTHDTFLAALEQIKAGKLQDAAALPAYLVSILKRTAWSKAYTRKHRESTGEEFDRVARTAADRSACPRQEMETKQHSDLILSGLKQLSPRDQDVLTRFYLQGETLTAIARCMGMTEQQVSLIKFRSKERLRSHIGRKVAVPAFPTRAALAV